MESTASIAHVSVKFSMFKPSDTSTKLNRNILLSALNIDTNTIITMFSKKKPTSIKSIYSSRLNSLATMLIKLLAMTCEKNSNNPIDTVPVNAQ